ncbi:hypothetical protein GGI25_004676 [Coemansia spiralis]|uniref:Uncharacterized protein n=2 Tax=Coemansia TaxID=4863 RepID=A0A9W8FZZ3_9FUNG|nr:hypothetical protein EDC05_006602 [Coemansia umbellata]KAJ2620551.1 hypothetical protein GGI26_004893 [Coemansia sp. RSA 1358]KAJ2620554.1 hypothetical protein GGI26_004896 [Coemansia sp. RSA 1358]KAJ2673572.1 hypothetical protein GGI25_004673 [Coemansia spiralis]KAJ2673575.1 hypothetical protein GGI25_004676 [Coemansia spiralis]
MARIFSIASVTALAMTSAYAASSSTGSGYVVKRCGVCGGLGGYGGYGYGLGGYGGYGYGGGFGFPYASSFTNAFDTNTNAANYNDDTLYINNQNANTFNTNTNAYNNANVVA